MTLLAAEAADLGHGHADDPGARERGFHVVELERLDDRFDLLHRPTHRERSGAIAIDGVFGIEAPIAWTSVAGPWISG